MVDAGGQGLGPLVNKGISDDGRVFGSRSGGPYSRSCPVWAAVTLRSGATNAATGASTVRTGTSTQSPAISKIRAGAATMTRGLQLQGPAPFPAVGAYKRATAAHWRPSVSQGLGPTRRPPKAALWPTLATDANGLARLLAQSSQSTDLRTYQPLSSRVETYSAVQGSPVAPTTLLDCAT